MKKERTVIDRICDFTHLHNDDISCERHAIGECIQCDKDFCSDHGDLYESPTSEGVILGLCRSCLNKMEVSNDFKATAIQTSGHIEPVYRDGKY